MKKGGKPQVDAIFGAKINAFGKIFYIDDDNFKNPFSIRFEKFKRPFGKVRTVEREFITQTIL